MTISTLCCLAHASSEEQASHASACGNFFTKMSRGHATGRVRECLVHAPHCTITAQRRLGRCTFLDAPFCHRSKHRTRGSRFSMLLSSCSCLLSHPSPPPPRQHRQRGHWVRMACVMTMSTPPFILALPLLTPHPPPPRPAPGLCRAIGRE